MASTPKGPLTPITQPEAGSAAADFITGFTSTYPDMSFAIYTFLRIQVNFMKGSKLTSPLWLAALLPSCPHNLD